MHHGLIEHLLKHIFLHLCSVHIGIATLLQLFLLLLHALLEVHVIDFLTIYFSHGVVVGEQFSRAVYRRKDEQQEGQTENGDYQNGPLTDLFKC